MKIVLNPITDRQATYIRTMQRRLHLPDRMLDAHAEATYGAKVADLDIRTASALIDEMIAWGESIPPDLQRTAGQLDMFAPTGREER